KTKQEVLNATELQELRIKIHICLITPMKINKFLHLVTTSTKILLRTTLSMVPFINPIQRYLKNNLENYRSLLKMDHVTLEKKKMIKFHKLIRIPMILGLIQIMNSKITQGLNRTT